MSTGARVELESVTKHFVTDAGVVRAVNGVSVVVQPGSSLAITGPSGCGKSTLLSLIGGLELPSGGRVLIDHRVISELPESERSGMRRESLGFVFQSHNLQPFLSAVENVSLAVALARAASGNGYMRSLELLSALGLGDAAGKFPDQLSGGERQRVAVARALVHRPRLILADEPTGSLDGDSSLTVVDLLLAAQARTGSTLIVISHDPAVASRLERTVALRDGEVAHDRVHSVRQSGLRA